MSRIILQTNRDYFPTINKLGLDRNSLHPSSKRKNSKVSPLCSYSQFIHFQRKWCITSINLFFFQVATGGTERAVYRKLIAPFKNDMPASKFDGFRRVCADHNYAYFGSDILGTSFLLSIPCQIVQLPETSYRDPMAFIFSKNCSYKGLINWRWDNSIRKIEYIIEK